MAVRPPIELLERLISEHPNADNDEIFRLFLDECPHARAEFEAMIERGMSRDEARAAMAEEMLGERSQWG